MNLVICGWPISRILSCATIHLGLALPQGSSNHPNLLGLQRPRP